MHTWLYVTCSVFFLGGEGGMYIFDRFARIAASPERITDIIQIRVLSFCIAWCALIVIKYLFYII